MTKQVSVQLENLTTTVTDASDGLKLLVDDSNAITSMLQVIKEIAEQTKV